MLTVLCIAAIVGAFFWLLRRNSEMFRLILVRGRVKHVSGHPPAAFVEDVRMIAPHASGIVRAVHEDGRARLVATGIDERTLQRLRNAFALTPMAKKGHGGSGNAGSPRPNRARARS